MQATEIQTVVCRNSLAGASIEQMSASITQNTENAKVTGGMASKAAKEAAEVRKLAERSQVAALEIGQLAGSSVQTAERAGKLLVGILVDAVNEVMDIAAADIEPAPAFGAKIRTDFIAGMGKVADKFVVILEPEQVLSVDDVAVLSKMSAEQIHEAS